MRELLKNLYRIAGKESSKITKMLLFEVLKSFFEGVALGATMLLLLKLFENLFERRPIGTGDVIEVFLAALLSVVGKIVCGYLADRNKYIASYNLDRLGATEHLGGNVGELDAELLHGRLATDAVDRKSVV